MAKQPALTKLLAACLVLMAGCGESSDSEPATDGSVPCGGSTAEELMPCVEVARLSDDIEAISIERVPGTANWQTVQDLCRTRLEEYGYQVELVAYETGVNVIARRPGTNPDSGEVIVSAHYDHIAGCPGADDNATGMAATLEIARLLATRQSTHPLVIACWDEEERGLIGSRAYADGAKEAGALVSAMFSFDAIGYVNDLPMSQTIPDGFEVLFPTQVAELEAREFRADYITLVADQASALALESFERHAASLGLVTSALPVPDELKLLSVTQDLRRSDHASFWKNDFPGIMISDTANFRNPNYHCLDGVDLPSTLDLGFVTRVTQATLGSAIDTLEAP